MSSLTFSKGTIFASRYEIVRCIAQGGMGAVYEVVHIETERHRALKVMLPNFLQNEDMRARFRQEARVTARIASEYIVDVLDAGIDDATQMPFLVMELLEGEEIEHRLKRLSRFEPHEAITYLHQASLALDKTHRASIVHRDLKPGNLFLTEREDGSPRVKVLDFGIAKLVAEGATGPATKVIGTPLYMAPEQFQVGVRIGPPVDIFALGMIAFTLLTGLPYWYDEAARAASPHALYVAIMQGPKVPACARAMSRGVILPDAFDAWFAKVTAYAPHERFRTASSAIIALGEVFGVSIAQRSSSLSGAEPKRIPRPPSPSPLASTEVARAPQPHPPERASDAGPAGPISLSANVTVPLPRAAVGAPPLLAEADSGPPGGRASHTSSPALGVPANSTTSAVSHAVPAASNARKPSTALALAVCASVIFAIIVGSALLMRMKSGGDPESSTDAASAVPERGAPAGSATAVSSLELPRPARAAEIEPSASQRSHATPPIESSRAPAVPTSSAKPEAAPSVKPTEQPAPVQKPTTTAKPPPPKRVPRIEYD
jgi:serine/threonine-protein kinase